MTMIGFGSGKMWTQKSYQVDDPMWWRAEWGAGVGSWYAGPSLARGAV